MVDDRIRELKHKLKDIEARKERTIDARGDCLKVCLVGYTNAGQINADECLDPGRRVGAR